MIFVSFAFLSFFSLRSLCWRLYYESVVQHCHRLFQLQREGYTVYNSCDHLYKGPFLCDRFLILLISSVIQTDCLIEIAHLLFLLRVYDVQCCVDHIQRCVDGLYNVSLAYQHSLQSIFLCLINRLILTVLSHLSNRSHTTSLYNVSIYYVETRTTHI